MKLIKITNLHFIIVSDEVAGFTYNKPTYNSDGRIGLSENNQSRKITHSTQPLKGVLPLDLSEVKELIGEIDVEKLCKKEGYDTILGVGHIWIEGYNKSLEDNKEKKYTETDLKKCWAQAVTNIVLDVKNNPNNLKVMDFNQFIQSLLPKTEWDVDFVDGKLKLISENHKEQQEQSNTKEIEDWWDNLNDTQQNWLENKFYKDDEHGINTLEKVINCYNSLNKEELLILSGINQN